MSDWWNSLSAIAQVFWVVAILATSLLGVQMVLMMLGGDHDSIAGHADPGVDGDPGGVTVVSLKTITAFLVGLGWGGVCALKAGAPVWVATPAAAAAGLVLAGLIFWLMASMRKLHHDGSLDYRNAIGVVGTVYIPIPGRLAAGGQVEILVQGRLMTVQAVTRREAAIPGQAKVKVVELLDRCTLVVEPV